MTGQAPGPAPRPGSVVGVDLGGTKIAFAAVAADRTVIARTRRPTPDGPKAVVAAIAEGLVELDADADAVGVGVPGPVADGVLLAAPNLAGFSGPVPLADLLVEALGRPVSVANDATAGAVGEWAAGAGVGASSLLGVWLGTGVGAGLVMDGRPWHGATGSAGELGHVVVRQGGAVCGCGRRGCVEAYAGRAAMEAVVAQRIAKGVSSSLPEHQRRRGKPQLTSGVWAAALRDGDALATEVLDEAVSALGAAVGSALNLVDVEVVVVGGGLAEKLGDDLVRRVEAAARRHLLVPDAPRSFRLAGLGDDAGVVGAAVLAERAVPPVATAGAAG